MFPLWLTDRGAAVSFGVVALMLTLAARPIGRVLGLSSATVEGQFWWGGVLFLVVGRLAHIVVASPALLVDPLVVVRFTDAIAPIPGALVALAFLRWRGARAEGADRDALWAIAVAGLAIAAAAYDLACPLRASCHGTVSWLPFAFPMNGLVESRLATPVLEGVALLVLLAVAVRLVERWGAGVAGWALLASLAGTRLALMPVSAAAPGVPDAVALAIVTAASVGLAVRAAFASVGPLEPPGASPGD